MSSLLSSNGTPSIKGTKDKKCQAKRSLLKALQGNMKHNRGLLTRCKSLGFPMS